MKPGTELDALIAEHLMGWMKDGGGFWKSYEGDDEEGWFCPQDQVPLHKRGTRYADSKNDPPEGFVRHCYPYAFSTSIEESFKVIEKFNSTVRLTRTCRKHEWHITGWIDGHIKGEAHESTLPHAVCIAALMTKGILPLDNEE